MIIDKKIVLNLNVRSLAFLHAGIASSLEAFERRLDIALSYGHVEYARFLRERIAEHEHLLRGLTTQDSYSDDTFEVDLLSIRDIGIVGIQLHEKLKEAIKAKEQLGEGESKEPSNIPANVISIFDGKET